MKNSLLLGTSNAGKLQEFIFYIEHFSLFENFQIHDLNEFKDLGEPIEDGKTFKKNAEIKSKYFLEKTNSLVLCDDVKSNDSVKSVVEGLDLIAQSTLSTFEKIGIKKIESLNEKFDHNLHQAMMEIEKNDCEPGTIVQELIPGYTLHDRLLRPAMVGVSKKPQENQDAKDTEEEEQSEK